MIRKYIKVIGLTFFALIFCLALVLPVRAATPDVNGIIVSPPLTEKELTPGTVFTDTIKITNPNQSTPLLVDVTVNDFSAKGEDGQQNFSEPGEETSSFALSKWITVLQEFTIEPNESKEISYSITVPANAEPGGKYGVIFFSPSIPGSPASGNSVIAIPKIGALLLMTVPGQITYDGKIVEFSANKKLYIDSNNVVNFLTRFNNLSAAHVKPQGNIVIKNTLGKEVASIPVNEKSGNVLPDSIRKFENTWQKKWGFGYYKASVNLTYATGKNATAKLTFWIIPWKATGIAILVLVILFFIIRNIHWGRPKPQPSHNAENQTAEKSKPSTGQ